jgi:hypothetical protein
MFKDMFQSSDDSYLSVEKHYPESMEKMRGLKCSSIFRKNIEQGIAQKLYREDINIESYVTFYFNLIFSIKESTSSEEESQTRRNFRIPH